tara:strand:- start:7 stop:795 length:789 start_codon:yes stop_codon:yes gene_type:complete
MAVTNTGIVERVITGVHDANFVRPLSDNFIDPNNWTVSDWTLLGEMFEGNASVMESSQQIFDSILSRDLIISFKVDASSGQVAVYMDGQPKDWISESGEYEYNVTSLSKTIEIDGRNSFPFTGSVYDISVKQLLVNRESTATNTGAVERSVTGVNDGGDLFLDNSTSIATNTGIVERPITGVNESDLWLDSESTSIVNNTGIVERPITGVNESDPMFPDNTISNIVNIAGLISSLLADLEARATTFENRDATQEILINLQKC